MPYHRHDTPAPVWAYCRRPSYASLLVRYRLRHRQIIIYYFFICHPTIAGDSANILLNFTIHDANAIDIYIYTLRRLLSVLYQSNLFSNNVIMCLTTLCVSDATLYARIQSSTQTFVRCTLLLFLEKPQSFLLLEILILPKRNSTWYLSERRQIVGVDACEVSLGLPSASCRPRSAGFYRWTRRYMWPPV